MFNYPDPNQMQMAVQQNPSQAAAAGLTQAQGAAKPGPATGPGATTMGQVQPGLGFGAGRQTTPGVTPGAAPANPGSYGQFGYSSPQWYGQGNEYGTSAMASSPGAFWGGYSEDVMGLRPGSNAGSFLANKYNPFVLGDVMYGGQGIMGDDKRLASSTSIANQIAGPGTTFFDPGMLVGKTLQALASSDLQTLYKTNPALAHLVTENTGNPAGQIDSLIGFFKDLLSATMPADALQAFIGQVQAMGQLWFSQMRKNPNLNAMDASTFAQFLIQTLGPTMGL